MEYEIGDDPQGLPEETGWLHELDFTQASWSQPSSRRPNRQRAIDFPEQSQRPG